jgi:hypothetical protein
MKYLLITTINKNPGDAFIRIGVENVLLGIDSDAKFELLDKEDESTWGERSFDLAIWCGMPMWWDDNENHTANARWWSLITDSWITRDRKRCIAIGLGNCIGVKITSPLRYAEAIETIVRRFSFVSVRSPVIYHPDLHERVCPALFAIPRSKPADRFLRLVNMLPFGGHYPNMMPRASAAWQGYKQNISLAMQVNGFRFIAHSINDRDEAKRLGWMPDEILGPYNNPRDLLANYAVCSRYFGNRIHGAIVAASAGADVLCVGTDSRIMSAQSAGVSAAYADKISANCLSLWAGGAQDKQSSLPDCQLNLRRSETESDLRYCINQL